MQRLNFKRDVIYRGRDENLLLLLFIGTVSQFFSLFIDVNPSVQYFNRKIDMPTQIVKTFFDGNYGSYLSNKGIAIEAEKHGLVLDVSLDDLKKHEIFKKSKDVDIKKILSSIPHTELKTYVQDWKSAELMEKIVNIPLQLPTLPNQEKKSISGVSYVLDEKRYTVNASTININSFIKHNVSLGHPMFNTLEQRSGKILYSKMKLDFSGDLTEQEFIRLSKLNPNNKIETFNNITDKSHLLFTGESYMIDNNMHCYIMVDRIIPAHAVDNEKAQEVYKSTYQMRDAYWKAQELSYNFNLGNIKENDIQKSCQSNHFSTFDLNEQNLSFYLIEQGKSLVYLDTNHNVCIFIAKNVITNPGEDLSVLYKNFMGRSLLLNFMNYWISIAE